MKYGNMSEMFFLLRKRRGARTRIIAMKPDWTVRMTSSTVRAPLMTAIEARYTIKHQKKCK